jgi:hypothetical protein
LEWFYSHFKLEGGLILGTGLITLGGFILTLLVIAWLEAEMLPLPRPEWASFAATLIIIGCGVFFSSLFISSMSIDQPGRSHAASHVPGGVTEDPVYVAAQSETKVSHVSAVTE